MVEPLEETRLELTFATEPLLSTLQQAIPMSSRGSESTDLDEIEVRLHTISKCQLSNHHSDPKRYPSTFKGARIPSYISKTGSYEYYTIHCLDQCSW